MSVAASATASSSSTGSSSSTVRRTAHANEMEVLMPNQHSHQQQHTAAAAAAYNETARNLKRNIQRAPSQEDRDAEAVRRRARLQERRQKARSSLAALSSQADAATTTSSDGPVQKGQAHRLTQEQVEAVQRRTSWFGSSGSYSYNAALGYLASPAADYDKWAQAYRMLGAFIDCDHDKDAGSQDNGNNGGGGGCSRWMMWAAVRIYTIYLFGLCSCICLIVLFVLIVQLTHANPAPTPVNSTSTPITKATNTTSTFPKNPIRPWIVTIPILSGNSLVSTGKNSTNSLNKSPSISGPLTITNTLSPGLDSCT